LRCQWSEQANASDAASNYATLTGQGVSRYVAADGAEGGGGGNGAAGPTLAGTPAEHQLRMRRPLCADAIGYAADGRLVGNGGVLAAGEDATLRCVG